MAKLIGKNRNTTDETVTNTYTINSNNPVNIAVPNPDRLELRVWLDGGTTNVNVFIREYEASVDSNKAGGVISRRTRNNDAIFYPLWEMSSNDVIHTGYVSAITDTGSVDVHVVEK